MINNHITVYAYNLKTLEFLNPVNIQENPKYRGEYLIPPDNTTDVKPPVTGNNEVAVISSDYVHWEIKPDYRGTYYYLPDGSQHQIEHIGETLPDNALPSPPEPTVEQVAQEKSLEVSRYVNQLLVSASKVYSQAEMISWDKQELEARRWNEWKDTYGQSFTGSGDIDEPETEFLDQILITHQDKTKEKLVNSIIKNADSYAATGKIFGIRHNLDKKIHNIMIDKDLSDDEKKFYISDIDIEAEYELIKR